MTSFVDALGDLIGLTEPHLDEYDGGHYVTPSLIDHDREEAPHPHGNHENPIP